MLWQRDSKRTWVMVANRALVERRKRAVKIASIKGEMLSNPSLLKGDATPGRREVPTPSHWGPSEEGSPKGEDTTQARGKH